MRDKGIKVNRSTTTKKTKQTSYEYLFIQKHNQSRKKNIQTRSHATEKLPKNDKNRGKIRVQWNNGTTFFASRFC